jgi:hypothetical protein
MMAHKVRSRRSCRAKRQKLSTLCGAYEPLSGRPKSGAEQLRHKCGEASKVHEIHLLNRTGKKRFGAELVRRGSAGMIAAGGEQC